MMKRAFWKAALWMILLCAFGLFFAGCYTVLVHPQVETTGEDNSPRMCSDCHSSSDYYYWHFPYQYNWYSRNPYWNHYYQDPWWYDNYWYWDEDHGGSEPSKAPQRHLWQPRVPPGSEPTLAPGTSGNATDDGKSSGQGSGQSDTQNKQQTEKHLWQPRVPPKDTDAKKPDTTDKSDKSSDEKVEEQK